MQLVLMIADGPNLDPVRVSRLVHWIRNGQTLVVGRDRRHAEVAVTSDANMSGKHFQVACQPTGCWIKDLDSRHGTFVNGERVTEAPLQDGDQIEAGRTRFNVQVKGGNIAPMPEPFGPTAPDTGVQETLRDEGPEAPSPDAAPPPDLADTGLGTGRAWGKGGSLQVVLSINQSPSEDPLSSLDQLLTWIRPHETVSVGRSHDRADMAIHRDRLLSGLHFQLSNDGRFCHLKDLDSTNGTFLNGQRVSAAILKNGDEIRAGRTNFSAVLEGGEVATDERVQAALVSAEPVPEPIGPVAVEPRYRIVNTSPFNCAPLVGQIEYPDRSLTFIVKGTFDLSPGAAAVLADKQEYPTGTLPHPGDDEQQGPPRYESDFAFFKPRADLLLVGACHAPNGTPVARLPVEFRVGSHRRTLEVFGKRTWNLNANPPEASDPEPFRSLELRYEHSFGGAEFDANPVGIGYSNASPDGLDQPHILPRIENPDALLKSPDDVVEPAGFGPEGQWCGRRRAQMGTYDKNWEQNRWPWFPSDLDWSYANAAPRGMQVDGYLRGDEEVCLKNLLPQHAEFRGRLPETAVRCFVSTVDHEFNELEMRLDTLWVDTENEKLVLVWRGHTRVATDQCAEIQYVYVVSRPLAERAKSLDECHAEFLTTLAAREAAFQPPVESEEPPLTDPLPETAAEQAAEEATDEPEQPFQADLLALKNQIRDTQIAAGADPREFDRQVAAHRDRLVREWGLDGEVDPVALEAKVNAEFDRLKAQVRDAQRAAGHAVPERPDPSAPDLEEAGPAEEPASGAWTRQRVVQHIAAGGDFAHQDLSKLDLSDLDLSGADFSMAILAQCRLVGSQLVGTKMVLANLNGTDFSGADLRSATLDRADFTGANLAGCRLDKVRAHDAVFSSACLTGTSFHQADAVGANFSGADCTAANMSSAQFTGAKFVGTILDKANMSLSVLVEAEMGQVHAHQTDFKHGQLTKLRASGGDFLEATFWQATARDSIWEGAGLVRADFSCAQLRGANFTGARLVEARLAGADLKSGRLAQAQLHRAKLNDMNLFEADLRQADLTDADVRRANLYGAELFESIWKGAQQESANFKMTKMADTVESS